MLQAHPGDRDCALASCAGAAPVLVDLKTGAKTPLPLSAPEMCAAPRQPPLSALHLCIRAPLRAAARALCAAVPAARSSPRRRALSPPAARRGDDAPTGGRRGGADALSGQAVFSKGGESAFVGTTKGWLFLVDLASVSVREGLRLSGGASVKHLALSRSGTVLLANCGDRTIRTFDVAAAAPPPGGAGEGEKALRAARDFKNAVSAVQWGAAALSADSDYVVGASGGNGEHLLYVWCVFHPAARLRAAASAAPRCASLFAERTSPRRLADPPAPRRRLRQHGTLEKILEGPQTATVNQARGRPPPRFLQSLRPSKQPQSTENTPPHLAVPLLAPQVAWHPKRCVLAALSGDGRIYLWAKILQENWSAFAPDFKARTAAPRTPHGHPVRTRGTAAALGRERRR